MSWPQSPRVLGTGGRRAACSVGARAVVASEVDASQTVLSLPVLPQEQKLDTLAVWPHQGEDSGRQPGTWLVCARGGGGPGA